MVRHSKVLSNIDSGKRSARYGLPWMQSKV